MDGTGNVLDIQFTRFREGEIQCSKALAMFTSRDMMSSEIGDSSEGSRKEILYV